jgi:predicted nucleic acid-binding protein
MNQLYDSSSIINLCAKRRLDKLLQGSTLSLAFYEVGNAVWKQVHLQRSLTREEGEKALSTLFDVLKRMNVVSIEDSSAVLSIGVEEGLTYYDASYIHAAHANGLTLITDDERLRSIAKKYVQTATSSDIHSSP